MIKAKTFVKFIGESKNGIAHGNSYFVDSQNGDFVWLCNMWNTLTRVGIEEVEPIKISVGELNWGEVGHGVETEGKRVPEIFTDTIQANAIKGFEFGKPKPKMKISKDQIDAAIESNEIYRRTRDALNDAQREQVGYGMGKYPELLNADTWTILETIKHIKGELVDGLHYLTMLEIKLEKIYEEEI
jgi:hypothetical protein